MIVVRLGKPHKTKFNDSLGRDELGFRAGLTEEDYWIRARGPWRLDERRAMSETFVVVVDSSSTILAVAELSGLTKLENRSILEGDVLKGHQLVGRKCPFEIASRNPIGYFDDIPKLTIAAGDTSEVIVHGEPLKAPLRVLSLFSGAGGLDIGFNDSKRYKLIACVELDDACCRTLRANHKAGRLGDEQTQIIQADISSLNPKSLMEELGIEHGGIDVVIGGPPCQSWSTTGRRRTAHDARGMLVWHFLRFVEEIQPDYFLMENVRGILSAAFKHRPIAERPEKGGPALQPEEKPGSAIGIWLDDATSMLGGIYHVDYFEVNSANYGAPEIRERVLFFGNKRGQQIEFPDPLYGPNSSTKKPFRTLRDAIGGLHESEEEMQVLDFSPRKKHYLSYVPEGGNWRAMPDEIQRESMGRAYFAKGGRSGWWRRLSWDLPSPTIVTMPNHASTALCHPTEDRALSVRECACIQEFPSNWIFCGTTAEQMRQVGNAVPARLSQMASDIVFDAAMQQGRTGNVDLPKWTHRYINSMVRTRQWYKQGVTYLHHGDADVPIA